MSKVEKRLGKSKSTNTSIIQCHDFYLSKLREIYAAMPLLSNISNFEEHQISHRSPIHHLAKIAPIEIPVKHIDQELTSGHFSTSLQTEQASIAPAEPLVFVISSDDDDWTYLSEGLLERAQEALQVSF